ncbi:MAG: hypothetical protein R3E67_02805 [Pseudomonadales bacterium]
MSNSDKRAKGVKAFNAVYGGMMTAPETPTGDEFFEIMMEDLFGNIWSREVCHCAIAACSPWASLPHWGEADVFGIEVETGLASGHLTEEQVNELILHMVQYVGYRAGMRGAAGKAIPQLEKQEAAKVITAFRSVKTKKPRGGFLFLARKTISRRTVRFSSPCLSTISAVRNACRISSPTRSRAW